VATFITRLEPRGSGPRGAVKDIIDVAGVPTTPGCRAIASTAQAAERDAACLAGCRAADARLVGKANLHELAMLPLGTNPWFGTPVNPLDPALIPGGSSSGSAVAVATGEADVALGSDTGWFGSDSRRLLWGVWAEDHARPDLVGKRLAAGA
jgi:amidase